MAAASIPAPSRLSNCNTCFAALACGHADIAAPSPRTQTEVAHLVWIRGEQDTEIRAVVVRFLMRNSLTMTSFGFGLAFLLAMVATCAAPAWADSATASAIADEAVVEALTLSPGYKRDVILRAVSRNLRYFGKHEAGVRAARAMSDGGKEELPQGDPLAAPRYTILRGFSPDGDLCAAGPRRGTDGQIEGTTGQKEQWARECLLERDFHWIGMPDVGVVQDMAVSLQPGQVKSGLLSMLIRAYGNADTLRFVEREIARDGNKLPAAAQLREMLAEPANQFVLGQRDGALAAARQSSSFRDRATIILLLLRTNDAPRAIQLFESLATTPPEYAEDCSGWFNPFGGLHLPSAGRTREAQEGIGAFLDLLPSSLLFRRICPTGFDASTAVEYLSAAGRREAALARALEVEEQPFMAIDVLIGLVRGKLAAGDRVGARASALQAAGLMPPFDPGQRPATTDGVVSFSMNASTLPAGYRAGERPGDTHRRFEVIRLLAAAGAIDEADALARKQQAGAMRAVALSVAAAGRAGIPVGDQAPSLSVIEASDL